MNSIVLALLAVFACAAAVAPPTLPPRVLPLGGAWPSPPLTVRQHQPLKTPAGTVHKISRVDFCAYNQACEADDPAFPRSFSIYSRSTLFRQQWDLVSYINAANDNGIPGYTYRAQLTCNADLTQEERLKARGLPGIPRPAKDAPWRLPGVSQPYARVLPTHTVDWRNVTTPIRDQGQCGSCWAFSATEQLESWLVQSGHVPRPTELSVEEVVDCDSQCQGCMGCWPNWALEWVKRKRGLAREADWPYVAGSGAGEACQRPSNDTRPDFKTPFSTVVNVTSSPPPNASVVHRALYKGPVSAALMASSPCFENYASGVFTCAGCDCSGYSDHAIQLIGIGHNATLGAQGWYYTLRNSWGTSWGKNGYMEFSAWEPDLANILDNVVRLA